MVKYLKLILTAFAFVATALIAVQIIKNARLNQEYKNDSAELNHFTYGLLSVNTWKIHLSSIISDEIDRLYMTRKSEKALKAHLETQLGILIDRIVERMEEQNKKSLKGVFKQKFMESFVDINEIKKGIPVYADAMMAELSSSKNEGQLKKLLKTKFNQYMKETHDADPTPTKTLIVKKYGMGTEKATTAHLSKLISQKQEVLAEQALLLIALAVLIFALEAMSRNPLPPSQYILLTMILTVLLSLGVSTPMIDMEAKLSKLSFVLFDHPVQFKEQVLYFQSKSIMDVFWIMITHRQVQMKFVGILMVGFSVVFPVLKMMSSLAYYYDFWRARNNRLIQFFVLRSGKWSMADVLVVAIFMAYIGFNGIINSQLGKLGSTVEGVELLSTNGTSLQPGFYLFFAYTILAMFLSGFIKSRPYTARVENEDRPELDPAYYDLTRPQNLPEQPAPPLS